MYNPIENHVTEITNEFILVTKDEHTAKKCACKYFDLVKKELASRHVNSEFINKCFEFSIEQL